MKESKVKFRTMYDYGPKHEGLKCEDHSMAKQSFKDDCDINKIMEKYSKTGILPDMIKQNPRYGDFSDVGTYQDALHTVMFAEEQFKLLSAKVRDRFENDPAQFLAFATNPANIDELRSMGLAEPKKEEAVNPPSSGAGAPGQ